MKVQEKDVDDLKRLPDWVKCLHCQGKPTENDWLIEVIKDSNVLIHQSCSAKAGKLPGLDGFGLQKGD